MQVLNPIQAASIVVQSFPYLPNTMAIITRLSSENGEGSDDDLLSVPHKPNSLPTSLMSMGPADSLGNSLDALWDDIYLT